MNGRLILIALIVLGTVGGWSLYALAPDDERLDYRFATVDSGDVESVVVSSGTLSALNTVIVGSQLSGQIAELHADFNDQVAAGDLVARIDPRTFEARVQQARADVTVAQASIESREAELVRAEATLGQARRELQRREALVADGHVSASELDHDVTLVETTQAQVVMAQAAVATAEANLEQRQAALAQAELDLDRTRIRSPVSGTVINRQVEVGQTVAATFAAPVLFEIGQDLHRMQVEASVDEADIGRVREGMACRFTVDAYPERTFRGRIEQVRKAPDMLQNVVTYKVIVTADNADLALLPGMTANVEMILGSKTNVLKVPNAALPLRTPRGAFRGTRGGTRAWTVRARRRASRRRWSRTARLGPRTDGPEPGPVCAHRRACRAPARRQARGVSIRGGRPRRHPRAHGIPARWTTRGARGDTRCRATASVRRDAVRAKRAAQGHGLDARRRRPAKPPTRHGGARGRRGHRGA